MTTTTRTTLLGLIAACLMVTATVSGAGSAKQLPGVEVTFVAPSSTRAMQLEFSATRWISSADARNFACRRSIGDIDVPCLPVSSDPTLDRLRSF